MYRGTILAAIFFTSAELAFSQTCSEVIAMAQMARAKSAQGLASAQRHAGDSYAAQLVYAYRAFQLQPDLKDNAERLLKSIPVSDSQNGTSISLGDANCQEETFADMTALSRVSEGLARELSEAVLRSPSFMPHYIKYAMIAVLDPHNDYAIQMRSVCRKNHTAFVRAVANLPEAERDAFAEHILNPVSCKAIAVPEQ